MQAEQDIPRRHHEERTRLERIARCLETAEPVFARLVRTDRGIDEAAQAIDQHTAAIDQAWADRLAALQQETARAVAAITATQDQGGSRHLEQHLLHCQEAETWLLQQRRFHYARADLVALRDHLAGLREDRYRLTLQAEAVLGDLAHLPTRADLPPLGTATPAEAVESLTHVRAGIRGARLALAASRSWAASITPPGILAELLVQTADVVAATAIGAASGREGGRTATLDYDVAIVDEAGQAQAMDLVVALSRARRVILVGDHQQLAPYVDEDLLRRATEKRLETSWLTKSLFELLWDRLPASHRVRLNTQFRMPESIARFLGRIFYEGDYGSTEAKRDLAPVSPLFQAPFVVIDTGDHPARWETARSPGYLNTYEAAVVARIAERLPASCRGAEGLGVIAPYGAQVTAIRRQLADVLRLAPDDAWLRENVATVDSFQGQERDVVIVSLTRSNTHGQVGFLRDLHRLNVTLSRARRQLIVLGDVSTLIAPGGGQQRQAFARVARELVAHARRQGEVLTAAELEARFHGA